MGGGPRVKYPKHVWSPAGGWYTNPPNWKANTAISLLAIIGVTAVVWKISAEKEWRPRMPEKDRYYPSRYWSKQIIEHERAEREKEKAAQESS
ncbi:hypothetical protein MCOR27_001209 [Pyricularia oryzae]|uniref:Uncharacterized protein n=5 Tax=Pyricularia TaxID=48558 RepID=A0ABQ8NIE7_PYRGI|nr:uncharacterized protein MGG_01525 [Pyricularia oryzae 70-15]KAH8838921.1 hypothetical protein MCOR01_008166 [Pyricularia oryzae]KAI6297566.1 hypothetical protein MCOR33_006151 [Pyricularia grisea]EHA54692.1 hypothetical protein MGG_01525 [Pyricularia oryzae 70-15]KAH9438754.1 hypothetical protein MCOR02_002357 [Pyricularia oryzae]KAI6256271.1 hypothetical protein MCOR19_007272 [Pyricularia oryzae]